MRIDRALRIIISPALRPLVQIAAVVGGYISFWIILLGIIGSVDVASDPVRTKYVVGTIQIERLARALEEYKYDCGAYPGALGSLATNDNIPGWKGPYISWAPIDPWGRPFVYLQSPDSAKPEILSYGSNGKPGGKFYDADISSVDLNRPIPDSPLEIHRAWGLRGIWIAAWLWLIGCIFLFQKVSRRERSA